MENRYLAPIAVLLVSLSLVSCGLVGDGESGLKIEYEARHLGYADRWDWQLGEDSMRVEIAVDGETIEKDVGGSPTLSGSFRVERSRGETAYVTAYIPSRDDWNAELEVSWGDQRRTEEGYSGGQSYLPPGIRVPLNE